MRRQGQYGAADSSNNNNTNNLYQVPAQAQPQPQPQSQYQQQPQNQHFPPQRTAQNDAGMNSLSAEQHYPYKPTKVDGQWSCWDRDPAQNAPKQTNPHAFKEVQGGNGARIYYETPDRKAGLEHQPKSKEARTTIRGQEQDLEIGYEGNALPPTFEGLERKFLEEIMELAKEQSDAEDAENARHREKVIEISMRYQGKLSVLQAQQATRRDEFLCRESQARLSQYQHAGTSHHSNTRLQHAHSNSGVPVAAASGEVQRSYATNQPENYRDRPQVVGGARIQGNDGMIPSHTLRPGFTTIQEAVTISLD